MNYYVDIRVNPSLEFSNCILMNKLFSSLHLQLVQNGKGEIGISFPEVGKTLGSILRLHGSQDSLERLLSYKWAKGLNDYITVYDINQIPKDVTYRNIKRVQVKSSTERLLRRSIRKGWLSEEEAAIKLSEKNDKSLSLPYLRIKSSSTGSQFLLFVDHGPILTKPVLGEFSAYGLSSNATIPWF